MELLLQQFFSGIATGGIYAMLALALVLGCKAIGNVNLGQGEIATFSTFIAWWMMEQGLPYWPAFLATVLLSFLGGIVLERVIFRPVERADVFAQITVFIGLFLIFNGSSGWLFGYIPKVFPSPLSESAFFQNKYFSHHELGTLLVTLVVTVSLAIFFQFTKLGLAMRASAKDPQLSRLAGIQVGKMLALAWGLAAAIAAIAGMLIAPTVFLDPNMMGGILLYAMTAAVLGGVDSLVGAILGGFFIGIAENLIGTYVPFIGNELKLPVALLIILIVLLLKPSGILGKRVVKRL